MGGLLEYMVGPNEFIDAVRVITALLGIVTVVFATVRFLNHEDFWGAIGFGALGFLAALQSAAAVGDPALVWRLPLYILGLIAGMVYLYRQHDGAGPRASR